MSNPNRYREIQFVGARILQARELNLLQSVDQGYDSTNIVQTSFDLQALYVQGAMLNVSVGLTGSNVVTFSAKNGAKPLLIFVRDRFESISNTEAPALTLPSGSGTIYLNWVINQVTSVQDASLVDVTTGDPTANMGELSLQLSTTDTSGVPLTSPQLSKNVAPIPVAAYTGSGSSLVVTLVNPIQVQAQADINGRGGLVSALTGVTPNGVAVGNDDARLSDERTPLDSSVIDSKVRTPVAAGGTNSDGTAIYNLTSDPGGISAAKIIMLAATQTLEAGWNWLRSAFNALLTRYNAHEGAGLGASNTHPFPTASQVGATPASHVGQQLGVTGSSQAGVSHPAQVTANTGAYRLDRASSTPATTQDPAFGVFEDSTNIKVAMTHDGDLTSALAALSSIPANDGDGPLTNHGPLSAISVMAKVLAEHVGKVYHTNPHGLDTSGFGTDYTYIDEHDAATLATAEAYTDNSVPHVTFSTETTSTGHWFIVSFAPNGGSARRIAFGTGVVRPPASSSTSIALPVSFAFTSSQAIASFGVLAAQTSFLPGDIGWMVGSQTGIAASGYSACFNGDGSPQGNSTNVYSYTCIAWL